MLLECLVPWFIIINALRSISLHWAGGCVILWLATIFLSLGIPEMELTLFIYWKNKLIN